jgi:hypothetical protein
MSIATLIDYLRGADLIDWLLRESAIFRGVSVKLENTCLTYGDYQATYLSGGLGLKQIFATRYPRPCPVTVQFSVDFGLGQPAIDATIPLSYAQPVVVGMPHPAGYEAWSGFLLVQWGVGASRHSAIVDVGGGALSLPACDSLTVSYAVFSPGIPPSVTLNVGALPYASPGATAIHTRAPFTVPAGLSTLTPFRQQWVRRWMASFSQGGLATDAPTFPGQFVVNVIDNPITGETSESILFGIGGSIPFALEQGWVESRGAGVGYVVWNQGAIDATCKIAEQIQVG